MPPGEGKYGVLSEDCIMIVEEYNQTSCHQFDRDGKLEKRRPNYQLCFCYKPMNVTEVNENYEKALKENSNKMFYFN